MLKENPWLTNIKLYENPQLQGQLIHADFETLTIQLSRDFLEQNITLQRDVFIRTVCSFIAQEIFHDTEQGEPYRLLVKRYIINIQQVKHNSLKNTSRN